MSGELEELLRTSGFELITSRYMAPEPRLEREQFSGGFNVSARERNSRRLAEACKVFAIDSMPRKLFCAPWVHELLLSGLGEDADDRIDALYAKAANLTGRGLIAALWKVDTAERLRAGQMSRYFWKRNPRPEVALVDDEVLSGQTLIR